MMLIQLVCENRNSKIVYTFYEVEYIEVKDKFLTIKQKDEDVNVMSFSADCYITVNKGDDI